MTNLPIHVYGVPISKWSVGIQGRQKCFLLDQWSTATVGWAVWIAICLSQ